MPSQTTPSVGAGRLPAPRSRLIGRQDELEALAALCRENDPPLITVVGPGGCGKTRLALAHAEAQQAAFSDSARLVELASIVQPSVVPNAVAAAIGLREQSEQPLLEVIVEHLGQAEMLLVIDNCEHVLESVRSLVDRLLDACPGVRVLATSRAPLGVAGERVWQVPPLPQSDAVELFVDRALAARRTVSFDEHALETVEEVCRRLDGLPLAIELAAARLNVLAVDDLLVRLGDPRLLGTERPLAEPRQRTLDATIEWSYSLLGEPDRNLFRRLAVFVGGWAPRAAEAVADGSVDALGRLVDQSLIVVDERAGQARHHFLETIRAYAGERLDESGEAPDLRRRHAAFFCALALEAGGGLLERAPGDWVQRLRVDQDNLRAALDWLARNDPPASVATASGLWWFWFRAGLWHEGRLRLETLLAGCGEESPAMVRALTGLGALAWAQGDHVAAQARLEESVALARRLQLSDDVGIATTFLSMEILGQGDESRARQLVDESVARLRDSTQQVAFALSLASVGSVELAVGDHAAARAALEQSVGLLRELDDGWGLALPLRNLGLVAFREGDLERATELVGESITTLGAPADPWFGSRGLESMAAIATARGEFARAARLFGAGEALRASSGAAVLPYYRRDYDSSLARIRAGLDARSVAEAWSQGRAMRPEQAVAYALSSSDEPEPNPLSPREREVLDLLSQGLSNRAITEQLVITEKTTEAHVSSILRKLNLTSRAQAAVWAVQHA
jgi:predicted ATPase/DNA-binding CsgD family transcriptional regulator